jgi:Tfp pilus assembly protein PilE
MDDQMEAKKKKRWWLIALIVLACLMVGGVVVLGLVVGIALPAWQSSARAANETAAIQTLNTIAVEERTYHVEHGSYATFDQLIEDGAFDKRFAGESPVVEGYIYRLKLTPKAGNTPPAFGVNADPQQSEGFSATAKRHFYMDSTGTLIHYNEDRPATGDDPPLGEH